MGRLSVEVPASYTACLTCAGAGALARKAAIWMRQKGDTAAFLDGEAAVAVGYLVPVKAGEREFCLAILKAARPHMRELVRIAHLTLSAVAQNDRVICRISEGNRTGERMARLVGFQPEGGGVWIFTGDRHDEDSQRAFRRRQQQRQQRDEGSGKEPAAAAGGE
ncbi:hypothetical protein [Rhizobium sp. PAMB 3182]